jgi:hypothetical protein
MSNAMSAPDIAAIARDPLWLAHRFDPTHDAVHMLRVERSTHRAAIFLTDEYLPADAEKVVLRRVDAVAGAPAPAPLHFILHSAYCCSTLLARAFDFEGISMGLKEPVILNDMVGWRRRGGEPRAVAQALDNALTLLARPFGAGEAVIVKPSNVVNGLAPAILAMRPQSNALLLYAPLRTYLASIAKKGMWGRLWARELLINLLKENMVDLGFGTEDYLGQTDIQAAAVGWLAQHAFFARLVDQLGPARVRTLDSETLLARPTDVMRELASLFSLSLTESAVEEIASGPAFSRHSKYDTDFRKDDRQAEHRDAAAVHGEEIEKVATWAEAVADKAGISMPLKAPLLRS